MQMKQVAPSSYAAETFKCACCVCKLAHLLGSFCRSRVYHQHLGALSRVFAHADGKEAPVADQCMLMHSVHAHGLSRKITQEHEDVILQGMDPEHAMT